jgi:glycosyltransferase involved in cell wall biosynthesis
MKYGYPLKLHEYLASGRPSVGSPLLSLQEFAEVVTLASTPEEWSVAIAKALGPDANFQQCRATRQAVARRYDWDSLVLRVARAILRTLGHEFAGRLACLPGEPDA